MKEDKQEDKRKVKWLLIGAGALAEKRVAAALTETENSTLAAVCDIDTESAGRIAEKYGVPKVFTEPERALAESGAEAVYVATPVFLHVPLGIQALQAGKNLLVEKPLGLTAADGRRLITEAEKHPGLRTGCAYYRRFYPAYRQAADMLNKGEFGEIVLVRMHYFSWGEFPRDNWRVVKAKSGGGPLSDMGSHMIDVMVGLLGMPETVYARTHTKVHDYEVEDSAGILMQLPGGADVVASFHWNSKTWTHEFEIVGTQAKVKWHPYDSGKVVKTAGREVRELELPNPENFHGPVVADFVRAVLEGKRAAVSLEEALKANIVLDAVYASSAQGAEITLGEG